MEMDSVELIRFLENLLQHDDMMCEGIDTFFAEPKRGFATRHQAAACSRIAARK
jgi:hypothetical protein